MTQATPNEHIIMSSCHKDNKIPRMLSRSGIHSIVVKDEKAIESALQTKNIDAIWVSMDSTDKTFIDTLRTKYNYKRYIVGIFEGISHSNVAGVDIYIPANTDNEHLSQLIKECEF